MRDITALVLTRNEAPNIARMLDKLSWLPHVVGASIVHSTSFSAIGMPVMGSAAPAAMRASAARACASAPSAITCR